MPGLKQSKKVPSVKVPSTSLKAQPPQKPFLSAEFVQDTSDEDSEKSLSNSERSPRPVSRTPVSVLKVQDEAPIATAKSKSTRPIVKNSKKPKPKSKSPSPSSTDSSAIQSEEDDDSGSGSESEADTENSSESIAQAPKQQKPKY